MTYPRIKKFIYVIIFVLAAVPLKAFGAEQGETEKLVRQITPPISIIREEVPKKDQWYFDSYYEPSLVIEANKTGRWDELTNTFGYIHQNVQGYFSVSEYDRLGQNDYTANWGTYLTFKDSYAHIETGFGWDIDYIYNFQTIAEYGHKLTKDVFWQIGYNYRAYHYSGDVHNVYPGLIYYFGDNYISANYGGGWIESRDFASFGTVKGSFAITEFLRLYAGTAFGERLYDIFGINPANKETGYILFAGTSFKCYKGISCRFGYIYGAEKPKFQKHGVSYDLTVKF